MFGTGLLLFAVLMKFPSSPQDAVWPIASALVSTILQVFSTCKPATQLSMIPQKSHYHRFSFCPVAPPVVTCIEVTQNEANRHIWWFYFTYRSEKKVRSSAQFLGSFGKEWEAKLPTYPLIINENTQFCAQTKNCAVPRVKAPGEGETTTRRLHRWPATNSR